MRDRLIELILKSDILCHTCGENSSSYCADVIADLIIADGWIRPPCKVGDTVYVIFENNCYEAIAEQVTVASLLSGNKIIRIRAEFEIEDWFYRDGRKTKYGVYREYPDDIFFTKEEAEQKLKERNL